MEFFALVDEGGFLVHYSCSSCCSSCHLCRPSGHKKGASIGMSVPYFIGSPFRNRIHKWLKRWPKQSTVIRLAGEGDWFHQFRAVTLIRISPFPYIIFNYASVATNVRYLPYLFGSWVGIVPEIFITIYSGRLLRRLADATDSAGFLSLQQAIFDLLGFFAVLAATIAITIYAKSTLQTLQLDDTTRISFENMDS